VYSVATPYAVLLFAVSSFVLGHLTATRMGGLLSAFMVRIAGAMATVGLAMLVQSTRDPAWLSAVLALPSFTYAPFAFGWVLGGRRQRETPWVAALDVVGLAALTVGGAAAGALLSGGPETVHVVIASIALVGAYVGVIVYAALAAQVRPTPPLVLALAVWAAFVVQMRPITEPGELALTLAPLLLLGIAMSSVGRLATENA